MFEIEFYRESIENNMIDIVKIEEDCDRIDIYFYELKRRVEQFVDDIIVVFEKKKQKIIVDLEKEVVLLI